ncbi:MAG: hypothetical protein J6W94_05500 [Bacteroidales bacterium]|nr:hypothetical protein [Bacteroidales bacterium]
MMKGLRVVALLCLSVFFGCTHSAKPSQTITTIDDESDWFLDPESGYRCFLGVGAYSFGMEFPEVFLYVYDAGGNVLKEKPGLAMTENGVIVNGILFYYYDIPEEWYGRLVYIIFNSEDICLNDDPFPFELKDTRSLWFMIKNTEISEIPAQASSRLKN